LKASWNRWDFGCRQNVHRQSMSQSSDGRPFHTVGPKTKKVHPPSYVLTLHIIPLLWSSYLNISSQHWHGLPLEYQQDQNVIVNWASTVKCERTVRTCAWYWRSVAWTVGLVYRSIDINMQYHVPRTDLSSVNTDSLPANICTSTSTISKISLLYLTRWLHCNLNMILTWETHIFFTIIITLILNYKNCFTYLFLLFVAQVLL